MTKLGMVIDLTRCIGCQTCSVSCKMQNNIPMGMLWNRVLTEGSEYLDQPCGEYPNLKMNYLPIACQHCENPACEKVCPVGATYKHEDGRVLIDYDRCIGCRYCMAACPYNARVFNWEDPVYDPDFTYGDSNVAKRRKGVVEKCSMCQERTDVGLVPMCVETCIGNARVFGDLDDPNSEVSRLIREKGAVQLLPEKGTRPQIYYIR